MFIKDSEIEKIEWETITFKDGSTITMELERQFFHLMDREGTQNEYDLNEEKFMLKQVFSLFNANNVLLSFDENEKIRDTNGVAFVAEIIKTFQKYDAKVSLMSNVFSDIVNFFKSIENLTRNNINEVENSILVKTLGIEEKGSSNAERLRNVTFSDYEKLLKD
jgi:hypothetical protein